MIDIKMEVITKTNKKGDEYKVMALYFNDITTGEFILFHEIYIKDNLAQIIEYITRVNTIKEKE